MACAWLKWAVRSIAMGMVAAEAVCWAAVAADCCEAAEAWWCAAACEPGWLLAWCCCFEELVAAAEDLCMSVLA